MNILKLRTIELQKLEQQSLYVHSKKTFESIPSETYAIQYGCIDNKERNRVKINRITRQQRVAVYPNVFHLEYKLEQNQSRKTRH